MRIGLAALGLLLAFLLVDCGGEGEGLNDDDIDWSEQCGTLMTIAEDDDQLTTDQARALDLYSEHC
jgi:hypothetical protein